MISYKIHEKWMYYALKEAEKAENKNEEPIGAVLSISFGDTSIYLIGITNSNGRRLNANYVLLWQAILNAKNDPMLSAKSYPYKESEKNSFLKLETPNFGGHVGFFKLNLKNEMYSEKRAYNFVTNAS